MKKFITFVAVAIMAVSSMNASNLNSHKEVSNNVPVIANVQNNAGVFSRFNDQGIKYTYKFDDEGRVVSRISYVANEDNHWMPVAAYTVNYGRDEVILNYGEYNAKTNDFRDNTQQQRFDANEVTEVLRAPQH